MLNKLSLDVSGCWADSLLTSAKAQGCAEAGLHLHGNAIASKVSGMGPGAPDPKEGHSSQRGYSGDFEPFAWTVLTQTYAYTGSVVAGRMSLGVSGRWTEDFWMSADTGQTVS